MAGDDVIKLVASKNSKTGNKGRALFRYGAKNLHNIDGKVIDDVRETLKTWRVQNRIMLI